NAPAHVGQSSQSGSATMVPSPAPCSRRFVPCPLLSMPSTKTACSSRSMIVANLRRFVSPEGASVLSQGREPLERAAPRPPAPVGPTLQCIPAHPPILRLPPFPPDFQHEKPSSHHHA